MGDIETIDNELMTGTWVLSKTFKHKHSEILKLCRKYENEMFYLRGRKSPVSSFIERKQKRDKGSSGGKPIVEYMLNYEQIMFLSSLQRNSDSMVIFRREIISMKNIANALNIMNEFDVDDLNVKYVYAVVDERNKVKIGITNNIDRRLSEIKALNSGDIKLVLSRRADKPFYQSETELHKICADIRLHNEWFDSDAIRRIA